MEMERRSNAGIVARHYFVQNKLGFYRSVAVAATYNFQTFSTSTLHLNLQPVIYQALTTVLEAHPPLSYGLVQPDIQEPPFFIRLEEIKFTDIVTIHDVKVDEELLSWYGGDGDSIDEKLDHFLAEKMGVEHDGVWNLTEPRPLWRCVVLNYQEMNLGSPKQGVKSTSRVDIVFVFHHGIVDGMSSITFHQTLQLGLRQAVSRPLPGESEEWDRYIVPDDIGPPVPIEDLIKINLGSSQAAVPTSTSTKESDYSSPQLRNDNRTDTTDYWTASNPSLPSPTAYKSRVRLLTIPETNLNSALRYCRAEKITLTGLLHGLLITSLTRTKPTAQGFISCTPYSLRPFFTKPLPKAASLGCYISDFTSRYPSSLTQRIRKTQKGSVEERDLVLEIARKFAVDVKKEFENVRRGEVPVVAGKARVLEGVEGYERVLGGLLGRGRGETFELSNIGRFVPLPEIQGIQSGNEGTAGTFELRKLSFAQCGMVIGAAVGCSVVSVKGGPLVAGFTWMEGVVEEEVVEEVVKGVREWFMEF